MIYFLIFHFKCGIRSNIINGSLPKVSHSLVKSQRQDAQSVIYIFKFVWVLKKRKLFIKTNHLIFFMFKCDLFHENSIMRKMFKGEKTIIRLNLIIKTNVKLHSVISCVSRHKKNKNSKKYDIEMFCFNQVNKV